MNPLLDPKHSLKLAVAAFLIGLTITGTMDYADAKLQEREFCKVNPKPDFCRGEQ